jgi:AraC-like DNA-binding protein/mannose-6-phosphate isomerase-like protein (cupin superfamily)
MNAIEANQQKAKIILENRQNRLIINKVPSTPLHNHLYSEAHIVLTGTVVFAVDGVTYRAHKNDAILIPPHRYHAVNAETEPSERITFYTDCVTSEPVCTHIIGELVDDMRARIIEDSDITGVYHHLVFIVSELSPLREIRFFHLNDHALQIREFFSLNYNKRITLSDLAKELHLSPMQTQRVIKKHTGKTFGENLLLQRMTVAENLMKTTEMSLADIAEYIGYESYCGFWKARRQFLLSEDGQSSLT